MSIPTFFFFSFLFRKLRGDPIDKVLDYIIDTPPFLCNDIYKFYLKNLVGGGQNICIRFKGKPVRIVFPYRKETTKEVQKMSNHWIIYKVIHELVRFEKYIGLCIVINGYLVQKWEFKGNHVRLITLITDDLNHKN